jgi:hypothetical protein
MKIAVASALFALWLTGCGNVRPPVSPDGGGGDGDARGGGGSGGGGAGGSGGSGGGAGGTGGAVGHDECHVDADCPPIPCLVDFCPDVLCVFGSDGFHHCTTRSRPQPTACGTTTSGCCTADSACADAAHGICAPWTVDYCGGPAPPPGNRCLYDQCESDADCTAHPHGFCSGDLPRQCVYGPCTTNADCSKRAGGTCVLQLVGGYCPGPAVFCRYPDDPCTSNGDCGNSFTMACMPNSDLQGESCQQVPPPPP